MTDKLPCPHTCLKCNGPLIEDLEAGTSDNFYQVTCSLCRGTFLFGRHQGAEDFLKNQDNLDMKRLNQPVTRATLRNHRKQPGQKTQH